MPTYRMTLRHGTPARRYHVVDIDAADLRQAILQAADSFPADGERTADLIEIRVHVEPESRAYGPE